ncbi:MAG: hypothetical protein R3F29_01970 [Planctomycetota bacterium]
MPRSDCRGRPQPRARRSHLLLAGLLLAVMTIAGALWRPHEAAPLRTAGADHEPVDTIAAPATATERATPATVSRVAAPTLPPPQPAPVAAPLDFDTAVEQLCELAQTTATLAQQDEIEAARRSDEAARQLFAQVLAQFADTGERSLALLTSLLGSLGVGSGDEEGEEPGGHALDEAHRIVLQMLLAADLQRRHDVALATSSFDGIDSLTQAALDSAPVHPVLAEVVDAATNARPFLRLPHEPTVLQLVQAAAEGQFPRAVATHLLRTLWDNLQRSGERSSDELLRLAVVLLETSDVSQVLVACRHLLAEPRFRPLVLARLRERGDRVLAGELAQLAAAELEPTSALEVLRELHPLLDNPRGSYLGLGLRAPDVVADAYRSHLAADTWPTLRRDLVMGLGMLPDGPGLELANTALANDPSPDVRIQAGFVLTVRGTPAQAERALDQLLDDPAVAGDPVRLTAVVMALQNLEHADVNVVARLASRLAMMPLSEPGRRMLDELVARSLPGGSVPGGAVPGLGR